jgi:hypothetical protein
MDCSHRVLFVPCRPCGAGARALRTGRLPDGTRTGIPFSSPDTARRVMGPGHEVIELSLAALRTMLAPIGVERVQLDPDLIAGLDPGPVGTGRAA